jgi:hypothetical protein
MSIRPIAGAFVLLTAAAAGSPAPAALRTADSVPTASAALDALGGPAFLENGGRLPDAVGFTVDGRDRTLFFGEDAVTIALHDPSRPERGRWTMRLAFEGARDVRPVAADPRPGVTNLFRGPRDAWRVGLRSYGRLVWRDLWPGIDLVWRAEGEALKWECEVRPGADPAAIRFSLTGAASLALREDGALAASTPLGEFVDAAPVAWQPRAGGRTPVDARFTLDARSGALGIALGAHDAAHPLVVDPVTFVRAGYVGGGLEDGASGVAVDQFRNLFVVGSARSPETSFPVGVGPDVTWNGGTGDAFVVKLDSQWQPVWSGYVGGAAGDTATCVVADGFGSAYLGGWTLSGDFPVAGTLGPARGGGYDGWAARISFNGRSLVWSGLLGGAGDDRVLAMAIERPSGRAVVAGRTAGGLPATGYGGGVSDGFVAGIRADGTLLDWSSYVGGALADSATGVAVDSSGNVYVCGNTSSGEASFATRFGPDLVQNGGQDAWVAKFDAATHIALYAGFIGGAATDDAAGIAVDSLGRAVVVGSTASNEATFPVAVGPHIVHHGKSDGWVARVAADGVSLDYCGYLGGTGDDFAHGVALDANRRAYVVGATGSTERGYPSPRSKFPVVEGPDVSFNGGVHDGFLGVVEPTGERMSSLGYIGGAGNVDDAFAVALHTNGEVVVAGATVSSTKTFPAGVGPALVAFGGRDGFIALLQFAAPSPVLHVPRLDAVSPTGFDVNVDWTDDDNNETGFEVQRTAADGSAALFPVPAPAAATGSVQFVDTTASPGTQYAYRVRGVSATGKGAFSECIVVLTTPSLDLKLRKSALTGAGAAGGGAAAIQTKYKFQTGSATASIDPVADGVTLTLSGAGDDLVWSVGPADPNWVVAGSVATWTEPGSGAWRVAVDTSRRTVRVDATGLTLAVPLAHNPVRVALRTGGSYGARNSDWRGTASGKYRYP